MIDFPIVDAHLHLWDIEKLKYPWLEGIPELNRTFSLDDYDHACGPIRVEKMIFMQCECLPSQYLQEAEMVTELSRSDSRIAGIVARAPLENGDEARPHIELLKKNNLVKGLRRIIDVEPDPEFCLNHDFIRGVNLLAEFDLTFDICISYLHNRSIIKFINKCPDVSMIIDHIGKPDIKGRGLDPWRDEMAEIAKFPNIWCKLSSLATTADHQNWSVDDIRPYVDHLVECFGFDRLVFASDWPVSSLAAGIPVCADTLCHILQGCSPAQLNQVFNQNALKFYHI